MMDNVTQQHRRCIYGGLMVKPMSITDDVWQDWVQQRRALELRAQWEREQADMLLRRIATTIRKVRK